MGVGDVLDIVVWDHPELTLPAGEPRTPQKSGQRVQADGFSFDPYVGQIQAKGKTPEAIRDDLTRKLMAFIPDRQVEVGAAADDTATEIGLDLGGHVARQITAELGAAHDLILVMEPGHRAEIARRFPQLSGKTMLFDHWTEGRGIADPYRKPVETHRLARDKIAAAARAWALKLRS